MNGARRDQPPLQAAKRGSSGKCVLGQRKRPLGAPPIVGRPSRPTIPRNVSLFSLGQGCGKKQAVPWKRAACARRHHRGAPVAFPQGRTLHDGILRIPPMPKAPKRKIPGGVGGWPPTSTHRRQRGAGKCVLGQRKRPLGAPPPAKVLKESHPRARSTPFPDEPSFLSLPSSPHCLLLRVLRVSVVTLFRDETGKPGGQTVSFASIRVPPSPIPIPI